jgi:hypothetical protein
VSRVEVEITPEPSDAERAAILAALAEEDAERVPQVSESQDDEE